ncbi:hypothetical protein K1718_26795 [Roseibium porphyridii]|uniref:Uncharacterized protein n=1 Tax=Roseibium porphyridii TaxID=2866279 RepID=A0ABY8F4J8_9HYPH|nr:MULTISPECIES: hypothetical protein [Stappiaceae]WFE89719.1 hypothetical protein K1718_26795 [Roseibium sp. KMA01]
MVTDRDYRLLADCFEAETLDARGFSHVDHIGVACQILQRYDFLDAARTYCRALQGIAGKAGAPDKFNLTVTLAFLSLLSERMASTTHETFGEFMEKNTDLMSRSVMGNWYSPDRLNSRSARTVFLMPDRFNA